MGYRSLTRARLRLPAVVAEDLDEHVDLRSDPLVREHRPPGRHTTPTHTAEGIERQLSSWEQAGLGFWTARWRDDVAAGVEGLVPGGLVGVGGCAVLTPR